MALDLAALFLPTTTYSELPQFPHSNDISGWQSHTLHITYPRHSMSCLSPDRTCFPGLSENHACIWCI